MVLMSTPPAPAGRYRGDDQPQGETDDNDSSVTAPRRRLVKARKLAHRAGSNRADLA